LSDETDVLYLIDAPYMPGASGGARYDDPAFAIDWPRAPAVISERDRNWAPYDPWGAGF
jgi:dTDP-4-dehydrorhamnose 3,5-epimerase